MGNVPDQLIELVERFDRNIDSYRNQNYNETQVRKEFIDPFFEALGWDISNKSGYAEAYKDVIHEDAIKVGGATKAPDYCFRVGPVRKFFLEAKKPSVSIKDAPAPAYQLRRYAWSAKLPLSILTDFEEFAVYDCRVRPKRSDLPRVARIQFTTYRDYPKRWDEIASVFSKEAVLQGSFDKYAVLDRGKRGTSEVDAEFLKEIEDWRVSLARNLALRNPGLTVRELNFAVQRTIDRIIFLRMSEDRGAEIYGQLQALLSGPNTYERLLSIYRNADARYNSGIFHFQMEKHRSEMPDTLTPVLSIDDKVLKDIIRKLYYPDSPYEFSMLGADILGSVYEQFLGKVIRLTAGHHAVVEEKPEVKKSGGVYYTPAYIVEYIVQNTVAKLCQGKTPRQVSRLRVLDPACGSGSFLIRTYEYLLRFHRDWYVEDGPEKHGKEIYQGPGGQWHLATQEKKRILVNNIFGVDIDSQAVEVTKLNLLLKVLEDENQESINQTIQMWHERALPDLGNNIKCGNSLIGTDYFTDKLIPDEDELLRVNPFDWNAEFSEIMQGGGFDIVIGNPPYGALASSQQIDYYRRVFQSAVGTKDSYVLFMEASANLLKAKGIFGMIVQSGWISAPSALPFRRLFASEFKPLAFVSLPYDVFGAYVDTVITIAERLRATRTLFDESSANVELVVFGPKERILSLEDFQARQKYADAIKWLGGDFEFLITLDDKEQEIAHKMRRTGMVFGQLCDIQRGVTPFHTAADKPSINPAIAFVGTVRRYKLLPGEHKYIRYDESLAEYKPPRYFNGKRLLLREMVSRQFQLQSVFVDESFVTNKSMQSILVLDDRYSIFYVLGLLNSRLLSWYFRATNSIARRDDFPKIVLKQTRELPFRSIDFSSPTEKVLHDQLASMVERMQGLHEQLIVAKTQEQKTVLQRQIVATDNQIDQMVYRLYGLSDAEAEIVEKTIT